MGKLEIHGKTFETYPPCIDRIKIETLSKTGDLKINLFIILKFKFHKSLPNNDLLSIICLTITFRFA